MLTFVELVWAVKIFTTPLRGTSRDSVLRETRPLLRDVRVDTDAGMYLKREGFKIGPIEIYVRAFNVGPLISFRIKVSLCGADPYICTRIKNAIRTPRNVYEN